MAFAAVSFLAFFISASQAIVCPKFTCASGGTTNTCASADTNGVVSVNSDGCDSSHMCLYSLVVGWASSAGSSSTYLCQPISTSTDSITWRRQFCAKVSNKTFKSGAISPIACSNNAECLLADGALSECICALWGTGKGVCKPDHNNDAIFSGYWKECGADGFIDDEAAYNYWTYYEANWVYQTSGLACVGIFAESKTLDELFDIYKATLAGEDSAVWAMRAVGVASLLV